MAQDLNGKSSNGTSLHLAERELNAFFTAVTDLYGSEQARASAKDWLEELESFNGPAQLSGRELRLITIAAAVRLAKQLTATRLHAEPLARSPLEIGKTNADG